MSDIASVADALAASPLFPGATPFPEPITEGGISIYAGQPRYKTVRFTGSHGHWPWISQDISLDDWRGQNTVVAYGNLETPVSSLVARRQRSRDRGTEIVMCCKADVDAPAWTVGQLDAVAAAFVATGACRITRKHAGSTRY